MHFSVNCLNKQFPLTLMLPVICRSSKRFGICLQFLRVKHFIYFIENILSIMISSQNTWNISKVHIFIFKRIYQMFLFVISFFLIESQMTNGNTIEKWDVTPWHMSEITKILFCLIYKVWHTKGKQK